MAVLTVTGGTYTSLLSLRLAQRSSGSSICGKDPFENIVSEMIDFAGGLLLVGSDDVVRAFNKFRLSSQDAQKNTEGNFQPLFDVMETIIKMRKDLGYVSTEISSEELLRIFINDLDEFLAN